MIIFFMFWNLLTVQYEKYNLHHFLYFAVLILYSLLGGFMFHWIEGSQEEVQLHARNAEVVRNSVAAKRFLVDAVQDLYFSRQNMSEFYETKLRIALDQYDRQMGLKTELLKERKWTIWGGLYYAGTIYTTIGYGDLAATTTAGQICTVIYAMIGIPLVITILNDWGTLLFNCVEMLWMRYLRVGYQLLIVYIKRRKQTQSDLDLLEECGDEKFDQKSENEDKPEPIPLILVAVVLVLWIFLCCTVFSYFENWSYCQAIYFFVISLTTIGFGDITPSHKVAVANFLFILIGLAVVSMSINIIQMNLELIFAKIVASIDRDFKLSLEEGGLLNMFRLNAPNKLVGDALKTNEEGEEKKSTLELHGGEGGDVLKEYGRSLGGTQRLLMRFMSNHQRNMLNEKFDERARMRNKYTQTFRQIKTASVQTQDKSYEDYCDYKEDEQPVFNKAISTKRLYIYNTGYE